MRAAIHARMCSEFEAACMHAALQVFGFSYVKKILLY